MNWITKGFYLVIVQKVFKLLTYKLSSRINVVEYIWHISSIWVNVLTVPGCTLWDHAVMELSLEWNQCHDVTMTLRIMWKTGQLVSLRSVEDTSLPTNQNVIELKIRQIN